jgi:hypothetical protein
MVHSVSINTWQPIRVLTCLHHVCSIFGGAAGNEGLGLFALSLDWNYVVSIDNYTSSYPV